MTRPSPDDLLLLAEDEEPRRRGRLTVFFGAAPGVGKTYAMLEAARAEKALERDVVVGIVETHGRHETTSLLAGLEVLPRRKVEHRGVVLDELDLDAALTRVPAILLVDEMAHTNAPGSRHKKRWQDIEELLSASIDVYTTLNVQHLESLNDVVAQITGVVVKETLPDSALDQADDVRLVDLPADELLERLRGGKVYVPEQAARAEDGFFRKGNLIALRELALRRTAEGVDAQMRTYRRAHGIDRTWPVAERILVCVSASPASARLLRAARRMAASLRAEWIAVYVETPASLRFGSSDRGRLAQNLRLAERLGAETVTLSGASAAEETLRYARSRNVTKVVVGKPTHPRWRDALRIPFLEEIVRRSGDIEVYVISGDERGAPAIPAPEPVTSWDPRGAVAAAGVVAISTGVAWVLFGRAHLADVVMTYLLGVVIVSMRFGYGPSLCAAFLSVITLDFFFIPPYLSFAVTDLQHVVTFAVMLVVAGVISNLTQRLRTQAEMARQREMRTARLYAITRDLAGKRSLARLAEVAAGHVRETFESDVAVLLPSESGALSPSESHALAPTEAASPAFAIERNDAIVAEWVWNNQKAAGLSTETLPGSQALFIPLRGAHRPIGVMGVRPRDPQRFSDPEQKQLLDTFASQIGMALERARLAEEAQRAQVEIEAERMRSSLLSSVSHDLRTPLGVITGAASTLLDEGGKLDAEAKRDLTETIQEEADRLTRLVRNLLDMTRLTAGSAQVAKDWQPLEEVVGAALNRLDARLRGRAIDVVLPADLPAVPIDAVLVEQVLINLLENVAKYSPPGTPIRISAHAAESELVVEVADRGPGIAEAEREKVFDKFYRLKRDGAEDGAGLGLAICRGVIAAHGGEIWALAREGGGTVIRFTLPIVGEPPKVGGD